MPIHTENVEYIHAGKTFEGFLAYDGATSARRPGVVLVHEWWGLNDYIRRRTREIAELGYAAFALDMYGKGVVTETHEQAAKLMNSLMSNPDARDRAEAGVHILMSNPRVHAERLAAVGYCMGGSMALHMARASMALRGVVALHAGLKPDQEAKPGTIKAKVLVCTGADDPMVGPDARNAFADEMRKAGADWQMNIYGGARHAFTNPAADSKGLAALKYNAEADKRSWIAMREFLAEVLA